MAVHGDSSRLHILGDGPFIPDEPQSVVAEHLRDGIITGAAIPSAGITGDKLATGILHVSLIDGVDGTTPPANAYTLTGIAVGDEIVFVGHLSTKASIATLDDVTSSFTVTDTDEITDGDDTDFSSDQLQVIWIDHTP